MNAQFLKAMVTGKGRQLWIRFELLDGAFVAEKCQILWTGCLDVLKAEQA
jgi:hypothetical protein